jgi:hypothetical protein
MPTQALHNLVLTLYRYVVVRVVKVIARGEATVELRLLRKSARA